MLSGDNLSGQKNYALCRKDLDLILNGNFLLSEFEELQEMRFFRINGMSRFWESEKATDLSSLIGDILNSIVRHRVPFSFVITGNEDGIGIYFGTMKLLSDSLCSIYRSAFPGIDIKPVNESPFRTCAKEYGGMFTGIPTNKQAEEERSFQIESICRGMQGKRFTYAILAAGIRNIDITLAHDRILEEMESVYSFINRTISGGAQGNLSVQHTDFNSQNYFKSLEELEQNINVGVARGMWRVNGYYAAESLMDSKQLGSIIKASFSGAGSKPESFRVIEYNSIRDVIANTYMVSEPLENPSFHPLGSWTHRNTGKDISLFTYKFQTILNSDQLSVLCQLPTKEYPGYYLDNYVEFDVSSRNGAALNNPVPIGTICGAGRNVSVDSGNSYCLEKDDFTRHALIIGITGGGKTNTSKSILNTLWNSDDPHEKIPFMVIESAKREYWEMRNLKGYDDLLVFTLGAEASQTSIRYRINPFEATPGISLQTHIDYLLSTFKAAFELYPPMPYILEKAVYEVYADRGWDIVENTNKYGLSEYPTLSDLYNKINVVVDNMGYHNEVQSNVKAALQARIYSLMIGGKGAMLNTPKSVPIEMLLSRPVIMELEDLGDDETKSFVTGILLIQLYEYRKSKMSSGKKELSHILLVEEAHRLLRKVVESGEGGNLRAKSVEFFCNLLAEIRTFGQGIIIADQIPSKLATDTIKNTNLKIVHRTVAQDDRETIGKAMNMTPEQIDYLSSLSRGFAAVYAEGDNRPKIVKLPLMTAYYNKQRGEVIREVRKKVYSVAGNYDETVRFHAGCSFCEQRCKHRDRVAETIGRTIDVSRVLSMLEKVNYSPENIDSFMKSNIITSFGFNSLSEKICAIGFVLDNRKNLNDGQRQKYIADYLRYIYG